MSSRRSFLGGAACSAAVGVASCKRQRPAETPEVWDDAPVPARAEALAKLAPPWPRPERAQLDNGLLTFWLQEPHAVNAHVRLLLPTLGNGPQDALVTAVCAETLRYELNRRLVRAHVRVAVIERFGRIEVGLHGPDAALAASIRTLGVAVGRDDPNKRLLAAAARITKKLGAPTNVELATGALTATLLGLPLSTQRIDAKQVAAVDREYLLAGWRSIVAPGRAVLVVHAANEPAATPKVLPRLAATWAATGRAAGRPGGSVLARLRPAFEPTASGALLGPAAPPPILTISGPSTGNPALCAGRLLPVPTPRDRAIARLAHRIAQEEHDVGFALLGKHALITTPKLLPQTSIDRQLTAMLDGLTTSATTRQPQRRLFSAAQLWLGARVVQSSIDGEDWTALFSESIELADRDDEIPRALARDATQMLAVEPDELVAWTKRWLDPQGGAPGWAWAVAGAGDQMLTSLRRASKAKTTPL